jgi:hypothetical protein
MGDTVSMDETSVIYQDHKGHYFIKKRSDTASGRPLQTLQLDTSAVF